MFDVIHFFSEKCLSTALEMTVSGEKCLSTALEMTGNDNLIASFLAMSLLEKGREGIYFISV